ncbi:sensor histidine kinase [Actinoplanes sp. URMC 104]|uniref:sensor histidine kinase n=1 Tax=Actinoplanes sp. URMC 104 TaxID=3423409 RepID=UPI003F1D9FCC
MNALSGSALRWIAVSSAGAAAALFAAAATLGLLVPGDDGVDAREIAFLAAFLTYALVGGAVAWHRPANPVGWLLLATGLVVMLSAALDGYAYYAIVHRREALPAGVWARWAQSWLFALAWNLGTTLPLLLFPDGRLPSRRWRWVVGVTTAAIVLDTVAVALMPGPMGDTVPRPNPVGVAAAEGVLTTVDEAVFWLCGTVTIVGVAAVVIRWRAATGAARERLAWLGLGCLVALGLLGLDLSLDAVGLGELSGIPLVLALAVLPVSVAVAILRAGLFDVQRLFTRGIVYAGLTVAIVGSYAVSVAVTPALVGESAGTAAALVATALAAVLLSGVRDRAQSAVGRALFGERDRPYRVLSTLGAVPPGMVDDMVTLLRRSLRLPYVAVRLADRPRLVESGAPTGDVEEFPLPQHGGSLLVARRDPADEFTAAERLLLADAARQVALAGELQAARERLVRAREQERLRLRRDLHDGLGPVLGAVTLRLDVLRAHVPESDEEGRSEVDKAKQELRAALRDVRRLIDGLRPPALDETGLRAALTEQASALLRAPVTYTVDCPADARPAGPAAQAAIYRIVVEALTNAARHSGAGHVAVTVRLTGADLVATVTDDGRGRDGRPDGIGLSSMRERAAELGGFCEVTSRPGEGVTVHASVPREDR